MIKRSLGDLFCAGATSCRGKAVVKPIQKRNAALFRKACRNKERDTPTRSAPSAAAGEKEQQTSSLVLHNVTTRLSRIILEHINKIKCYTGVKEEEHQHHLVNDLTDETLARMTGSVRQVVNQQLQHWKKQGTLDKKRNQMIIKDLEALEKEAKYSYSLPNVPLLPSQLYNKT